MMKTIPWDKLGILAAVLVVGLLIYDCAASNFLSSPTTSNMETVAYPAEMIIFIVCFLLLLVIGLVLSQANQLRQQFADQLQWFHKTWVYYRNKCGYSVSVCIWYTLTDLVWV